MDTGTQHFSVEVMKRLDIERKNEQFCDFILEVGSGEEKARLKAHRNVLSAASPYFYKALNSNMKENIGVIRLEETSKAIMEGVLGYIYTGCIRLRRKCLRIVCKGRLFRSSSPQVLFEQFHFR